MFASSAKATNEENFLLMKLARAVFGTNNIDHCARLCHSSTVTGLAETFGSGAMTNSISCLDQTEVILVIGSNTTEQHPLIGSRILNAVRNGVRLIVADNRRIRLARHAELHLRHKNGSDVALLWSDQLESLAFVALGATVGKPYKSVETLTLPAPVSEVVDVPAPNRHLKVLGAPRRTSFTVLDLKARTAAPLVASATDTEVRVAPDGRRSWFFSAGYGQLAVTDLATLHPKNFVLSHPITDVFDVARRDGGRALVALHSIGAGSVTVLDAQSPSLTTAREVAGLLQGGLP